MGGAATEAARTPVHPAALHLDSNDLRRSTPPRGRKFPEPPGIAPAGQPMTASGRDARSGPPATRSRRAATGGC